MSDVFGHQLSERFSAGLSAELGRWVKPGLPLRIEVGGDGCIQRRSPDRTGWVDIMTLGFLIRRAFDEIESPREIEEHAGVTLPFSLCQALGTAARLLEQILEDGGECRKTFPFSGPEFLTTSPRGLPADLSAAKEIREGLTRGFKAAILAPPRRGEPGAKARWVEFAPAGSSLRVDWRDRRGSVIHTEDLAGFLHRRIREPLDRARPRIEERAAALRRWREQGEATLRKASPRLLAEVESYRSGSDPLCLRLLLGKHRGVPLDAWICLHPELPRSGDCSLRVRRPHRSFVLENDSGSLFYFPSCLLIATLQFRPGMVNLRPPQALAPRGGYAFDVHPYTGTLSLDSFGMAKVDPREDLEILPSVSSEETRCFPELEKRAVNSRIRDLCLDGQTDFLEGLAVETNRRISGGGGFDVLGCVTRLHDFVRLGLTRGHERNHERPRVHLQGDQMLYPFFRKTVPPSLASRIFRFAPARKGMPRRVTNV